MRSSAQRRFTAVGRVRPSRSIARPSAGSSSASGACASSTATPIAAVTPIAGAPRTVMSSIARATASPLSSRT